MIYFICSSPRTGSNLLSGALAAMGAGEPAEYFNPERYNGRVSKKDFMKPTPREYVQKLMQEHTVNGVFGLKTHYLPMERYPEISGHMPEIFPNAKYISITRRNILRQSLSATKAVQTRAFRAINPELRRPRFRPLMIIKHLVFSAREIELWEQFFKKNGITPLRIVYEDLDEDYENTMRRVADFLGIKADVPPKPLQKQADELTENWMQRFCAVFSENRRMANILRLIEKFL